MGSFILALVALAFALGAFVFVLIKDRANVGALSYLYDMFSKILDFAKDPAPEKDMSEAEAEAEKEATR